MINSFYLNSNILNIPRELYKTGASNNIFKAPSLLFGSNYQVSYKKSINYHEFNRVTELVIFLNGSLKSIYSFSSSISKKNNDYFKSLNNAYNIVSSFNNFVDDVNYFLNTSKKYNSKKSDNLNILNKQIENDLIENKEELLRFGISIDEDIRLKLDEEELRSKLDEEEYLIKLDEEELLNILNEADRLSDIASKDDSVFNKISSRIDKVLSEPITKYIPDDDSHEVLLFNYSNTSEKSALNSAITTGNTIDYIF